MTESSNHPSVRLLGPGDEATLVTALRRFGVHQAITGDPEGFLARPAHRFFLARAAGQPAAFALCYDLQRLDGGQMRLIYEVGTDARFRRRGIGATLMRAVEADARARGLGKMWVLTNKSNAPAVALYESAGGVSEAADDVLYCWRFTTTQHED